ncbi:MAG: hypothetical protein HPY74_08905 [Firmicutes bacterium]|nr:hypothetical protein [Bacillota bacterium]
MIYISKEKVKSIVLALLILSSIIQVGILWVYQSHRLPFNFFSVVFNRNNMNDTTDIGKKAKNEIFIPYRIIASNGNDAHWLIKEEEDIFYKLWDEGQEYLKRILSSDNVQAVNVNMWDNLVVRKSFLFEFRAGIKTSLVKWFLNIAGTSSEHPESIYKILILPDEDINKNNTVYILSEKNLYKYVFPFQKNDMSVEDYNGIIRQLEADRSLVQYNIIKEIDPENKFPFKIPPDVLCVVSGPKYRKFTTVTYSFGEKVSDIEEVAAIILANEKESYDRYIDRNNTLVFKNLNNTYRLYSNGLLEYKYVPGAGDQEKGDIGSAFEKAYIFISRIKNYLMNTEAGLHLVKIKDDNPNYYEFIFEYMIDGYPVYISNNIEMKEEVEEKKGAQFKNAISIKVNSRRIIESNWLLINFDKNRDNREYNVYFEDMLNEISKKYSIQRLSDFAVKNIMVVYMIDSGIGKKIGPVWVVEKPDGGYYNVPMIQKKDD